MRNHAWTRERDREATVKAYKQARKDGAHILANNIKFASPAIPWAEVDQTLAKEEEQGRINRLLDNTVTNVRQNCL